MSRCERCCAEAKQRLTGAQVRDWDAELFTEVPQFVDGHLVVPDRPGWGYEPREEVLAAHPPKVIGGLTHYRQQS